MALESNEKGATLIEVLGVMAVLGAIALGLFAGIARVQRQIKITQAHEQVTRIVKRMRTQFASFQLPPAEMTAAKLESIGIYDKGDAGDDGLMGITVFGTQMSVTNQNFDGYPTFALNYYSIPPNVCTDLIMSDWGNDPSSGLNRIYVSPGGPNFKTFVWEKDLPDCGANGYSHCLPPRLDDAVEECTRGPSAYITWEYYY